MVHLDRRVLLVAAAMVLVLGMLIGVELQQWKGCP